jgi:hypothetical protein
VVLQKAAGEASEGSLDLAGAGSAKAQPAPLLPSVDRVVGVPGGSGGSGSSSSQKEPGGGGGVNLPISLPHRWDGSQYLVAGGRCGQPERQRRGRGCKRGWWRETEAEADRWVPAVRTKKTGQKPFLL